MKHKINNKKIFMTAIIAIIFIAVALQQSAIAIAESITTEEIGEQKMICTATIEDEFAEDKVIVTLKQTASLEFKQYTVDSFSEVEVESISETTQSITELVRAEMLSKNTDSLNVVKTSVEKKVLINLEYYRRSFVLTLKEKNKENVLNAIKVLEKRADVLAAEPDYTISACAEPDDTYYGNNNQWGLNGTYGINAPQAWDITTGSNSVIVGVVDSGIDASHPDLNGNIHNGLHMDFTSGTEESVATPSDPNGHGTYVAGIIGAEGNNGVGISGVCWDVSLVSLRVLDGNKNGYTSWLELAVSHAIRYSIPVLNISAGYSQYSTSLELKFNTYAGIVICSAGNKDLDIDEEANKKYPVWYDFDNKIVVGAIYSSGSKWSDSNYGAEMVDIFAPGYNIVSTDTSGYASVDGTSYATPFVTGVVALMLSVNPNLSADNIKSIVMENATELPALSGKCVTGGIVNAYESVLDAIYETTVTSTGGVIIDGLRNNLTLSGAVEIPEKFNGKNVTEIGASAFSGCTGLTSVTIPNTVTRIGQNAFYNTGLVTSTSANSIVYADNWAVGYRGVLDNIIIEEGTVGISEYAFTEDGSLDGIVLINPNSIYAIIPSGVQYIGEYAFSTGSECTIYTEYSSEQTGWDTNWNVDIGLVTDEYQPVIYDVTLSDDNTYVTELYKSTGSITNPSGKEIVDTAQSGYIVGAWFNNSAYTGTAYTTEQLVSAPSGRYYARWVEEEITITYRDVGGLGTMFSGYFDGEYPTTHRYGEVTELAEPMNNFVGIAFVGWYLNSLGSGEAITELSAYGYTEDIVLYAKWENIVPMNSEEETQSESTEEAQAEATEVSEAKQAEIQSKPKNIGYIEVYISQIKRFGYLR